MESPSSFKIKTHLFILQMVVDMHELETEDLMGVVLTF